MEKFPQNLVTLTDTFKEGSKVSCFEYKGKNRRICNLTATTTTKEISMEQTWKLLFVRN